MKDRKKNKTSKQKKALALSLLLAALIVIGTTFAWFTSSDEVTNKLTASNSYGVSITESFTPPEQWTPGQSITKEVSVINTGNVAAFVEVELSNTIELVIYSSTDTTPAKAGDASDYVVLTEEEADAIQAGGQLVRVPSGSSKETGSVSSDEFVPDKTGVYVFLRTDSSGKNVYSGYYALVDDSDKVTYYALDDLEMTEGTDSNGNTTYTVSKVTYQIKKTVSNPTLTFDYSHVYTSSTDTNGSTTYSTSSAPYIVATYDPDGSNQTANGDEIIINIYLYSVDEGNNVTSNVISSNDSSYSTNYVNYPWTFDATNSNESTAYFYFNAVLAAGAASENLVVSVELDESVTQEAYASFEYSLIVNMNSVQVTVDEDGYVSSESADAQGWTLTIDDVKARMDSDGDIIAYDNTETESSTYSNEVEWETQTTESESQSE